MRTSGRRSVSITSAIGCALGALGLPARPML